MKVIKVDQASGVVTFDAGVEADSIEDLLEGRLRQIGPGAVCIHPGDFEELWAAYRRAIRNEWRWRHACLAACRRLADAELCDRECIRDVHPSVLGRGRFAPDRCRYHGGTRPMPCPSTANT